ncbi:hypothetical protein BN8_03703 [Fibrisoma limi BUZ 3]|uniref:HNH nuclease domain-containing protein n=1 Tax=Fibrisoma limi BUZ 3 TaxID=1185876 RepID=I2GKU6_9BACT|nr:HNH endonuclease signature motif containing protein [Fibrisoma limi]CCH54522.1 hypothetical protein BN8_03703 [Fibrisoma limi BUZ 3]
MLNQEPNREPPDSVKRHLRQEAGFGCCICGIPIYDYHHIIEFGKKKHHNPDDMMLLCPFHHRLASAYALSVSVQREAKKNPYNIRQGYAEGVLYTPEKVIIINMGQNFFVGENTGLYIEDYPLVSVKLDNEGRILLSVNLYDNADNLLAIIEDNEWISGDPMAWDIEFGINKLTIREKSRTISLSIDASSKPVELKGHLWYKGHHFDVSKDQLSFGPTHVSFVGMVYYNAYINAKPSIQSMQMQPVPPFGRSFIGAGLDNIDEWYDKTIVEYKAHKKEFFFKTLKENIEKRRRLPPPFIQL